jgi:hypothetical protein
MSLTVLSSIEFLTSFLKYVFYILMFGALPLFLGFFAWYLLALMRIREINDLIEKGLPEDEAERRVRSYK